MSVTRITQAAGLAAVAAISLAACGSNSNGSSTTASNGGGGASASSSSSVACASGSVTAQGSTFQQAIEQQWTSDYSGKCSGAQVTYTGTGSGQGITALGQGKIDFAGSDVTMKPAEQTAANTACGSTAVSLPITAGGIAILYNLPNVKTLNLSPATIAGIFEGKITTWNASQIAADNPGVSLPSTTIKPFHRSDGSGTTSVLSSFLDALGKPTWTLGTGKTLNWPSNAGQAAKGSSGVAQGVKQTTGGIGYAEVSYAKQDSLQTAAVKGASGGFQQLTTANVTQAIASGFSVTGTSGNDLAGSLDFTKMTGYPISTVSYAIVCSKYKDAAKGTLVKDFLTFATQDDQGVADQLGFAQLPSDLASKDQTLLSSIS